MKKKDLALAIKELMVKVILNNDVEKGTIASCLIQKALRLGFDSMSHTEIIYNYANGTVALGEDLDEVVELAGSVLDFAHICDERPHICDCGNPIEPDLDPEFAAAAGKNRE